MMAEFQPGEPVSPDQMRDAGDGFILVNGNFRAAIQLQLFDMAGTHPGDFIRNGGRVHFCPEAPFRVAEGHAAVQIIGADAAEGDLFHIYQISILGVLPASSAPDARIAVRFSVSAGVV